MHCLISKRNFYSYVGQHYLKATKLSFALFIVDLCYSFPHSRFLSFLILLCQKKRFMETSMHSSVLEQRKPDFSFNMHCHLALHSEKIFHPHFHSFCFFVCWRFPRECAELLTNVSWVINWVCAIGNELDVKWTQKGHSRSSVSAQYFTLITSSTPPGSKIVHAN